MSYTEIYKFTKSGRSKFVDEIQNSHRSASAIWHRMEEKYLPPYIPYWSLRLPDSLRHSSYSRVTDSDAIKAIWRLFEDDLVSRVDKIALGSTFDNVVVMKNNLEELIQAFRDFDGITSLKEQADIIEHAMKKDKNLLGIAWNQTSIGEAWCDKYNILQSDKHYNFFENLNTTFAEWNSITD